MVYYCLRCLQPAFLKNISLSKEKEAPGNAASSGLSQEAPKV